MATALTAQWSYEYLPYTVTEANGIERELPNYRVYSYSVPELYIAETNERLPRDLQEAHARLIAASPRMLDTLLGIKRLAGKSGDPQADPFALLDLIAGKIGFAITIATGKASI